MLLEKMRLDVWNTYQGLVSTAFEAAFNGIKQRVDNRKTYSGFTRAGCARHNAMGLYDFRDRHIYWRAPRAAMRARKPKIRPSPPKNSAAMARIAKGAGMCIIWVKNAIVPSKPQPPDQPSIFWARWAKKTIPWSGAGSKSRGHCLYHRKNMPSKRIASWRISLSS
jgi:hypothetical protein